MNIFYLDTSPKKSAELMSSKHVVKMILESAQILSTAHRVLDGTQGFTLSTAGRLRKYWYHPERLYENSLYKATHINHPSCIWARESSENYLWLYHHFLSLCQEYTLRYHKTHATYIRLNKILANIPNNIPKAQFSEPPQAMPEEYKMKSSIQAYRTYYIEKKLFTEKDRINYYGRI
jgi:hypothetical protein